jgi:hypothetical protein
MQFELTGPLAAEEAYTSLAPASTQGALVSVQVKAAFVPARRDAVRDASVDVAPDDVIEIEFSDGLKVWFRADEYRDRFGRTTSRGGSISALRVPSSLPMAPSRAAERGVTAMALKALKVLGVNVQGRVAEDLAQSIESRGGLRRPGLGLFSCNTETGVFALKPVTLRDPPSGALPDTREYLVFLHGTLSSTWGSFGDLWAPERAGELKAIAQKYGDRVLAFEHLTLTVSPIQNALDLIDALPRGAAVSFVSHSRGGLVGELLSRAPPFFADEAIGLLPEAQQQMLQNLRMRLAEREVKVLRFVRVACPVLGTTLVSGRLDRWLSVVGTVASTALKGTPITDVAGAIGDFIAAVIKERTDPKTLPGIEAMMPESPFIKVMNWPGARGSGRLYVLAGDLAPESLWSRLLSWVTDRFYGGDHDLVVNTVSMSGGVPRDPKDRGRKRFEGPAVNHFNYFRNADSAALVIAGLKGEPPVGFDPFELSTAPIPRSASASTAVGGADRPVVFVLPGMLGTELATPGGAAVWLDSATLMISTLRSLAPPVGGLAPTRPLGDSYERLIAFLGQSHEVIPFPYDWRASPRDESSRLAEEVKKQLAKVGANVPIRFLAHSAGGLVVRAMIAGQKPVWDQVMARKGSRFVMLGTPNRGTHWAVEMLLDRTRLAHQLLLLDGYNRPGPLFGKFPGLLALLPQDSQLDYFAPSTWKAFSAAMDRTWVAPTEVALADAAAFCRELEANAKFDAVHMVYVAGRALATPSSLSIVPASGGGQQESGQPAASEIETMATRCGDGRVIWPRGSESPPPSNTWYMDASHGDLVTADTAFPAILDLLDTGKTLRLDQNPPLDISTTKDVPMPAGGLPRIPAAIASGRPLMVSAVNGNLRFAQFPVAAGHYEGDSILSAERALDRALGGHLSQRLQLALYPGPIGTNAVVMNRGVRDSRYLTPKGALIVGLGSAGALRPSQLTRSMARAVLEYVSQIGERSDGNDDGGPLGISSLLIGTGLGGISVADSVSACAMAVLEANDLLASCGSGRRVERLEFIELWRDRALQVMDAFATIETREPDLLGRVQFDSELHSRAGARTRASFDEPPGWWHRIQITGVEAPRSRASDDYKELRFAAMTRRARNEVRLQVTERKLVDTFVKSAMSSIDHDEKLSSTLFEMLLPNEFKDASIDEGNLVLLLDEESACYPWELLQDPLDQNQTSGRRPLICRRGVLRQLESTVFRESVQASGADHVLVVGDPVSSLPVLEGAQLEARTAARALEAAFEVRHLERPVGRTVLSELFARPYRVLHFAGHGMFEGTPDGKGARSGIVLGDDQLLTPTVVSSVRSVPDLVFVNCCHLGYIPSDEVKDKHRAYNQIAANVAQEFIRIGVRAVIAAGWAVEDNSAALFARVFYECMLNGMSFGEATTAARKQVYAQYPHFNTWGAYQCYGDPDFRLVTRGAGARASQEFRYAAPALAMMAINDVTAQLELLGDDEIEGHLDWLDQLYAWLEKRGWLGETGIQRALASAYWEALSYEKALDRFRDAVKNDASSLTLKDLEQYANLMARAAVDKANRGGATEAQELLTAAREYLHWGRVPGSTATESSEHLALRASVEKRAIWVGGANVANATNKMTSLYQQSLTVAKRTKYYPGLNLTAAKLVTHWQKVQPSAVGSASAKRVNAELVQALDAADNDIDNVLRDRPDDTYAIVSRPDSKLLRLICTGGLGNGAVEGLAREYAAVRSLMSRRTFGSVRDQILFLAAMAGRHGRQGVEQDLVRLESLIAPVSAS